MWQNAPEGTLGGGLRVGRGGCWGGRDRVDRIVWVLGEEGRRVVSGECEATPCQQEQEGGGGGDEAG